MSCPNCGQVYCSLPPTERKLMKLQDAYYENNKNEKYMTLLIQEMISYTEGLIKKRYSQYIKTEDILYFAQNAVSFIIEEYLKADHEYRIYASFGGFLNRKIRQAIFGKNEKLHEDISIDWNFHDDHQVHYEDKNFKFIEQIEELENKINLLKYISALIFEIEEYCSGPYENYIRLLAILLNLKYGEKFADRVFKEETYKRDRDGNYILDSGGNKKIDSFKIYGRFAKINYLKSFAILREELIKLL